MFQTNKLYRYEAVRYASFDEYGDCTNYTVNIVLKEYKIIKITKTGVWVEIYKTKKRFVKLDTHKKFACINKEQALESFLKRKERQLEILKRQIGYAEKQYYHALSLKQNSI